MGRTSLGPFENPPVLENVLTSYLLGLEITENIKINYEF
jgi:hypothetical protein